MIISFMITLYLFTINTVSLADIVPETTAGDPFQLIDNQFEIMENNDELESFSDKGKDKLMDLASQYESSETDDDFSLTSHRENNNYILEEDMDYNRLSFEPLPNLIFETTYDDDEEKYSIDINSDLSMKYDITDSTRLRANYNLLDEKLVKDEFEDIYTDDSGEIGQENYYKIDSSFKENVGIEYYTSENMLVSADYASENIFTDFESYSTGLGLEYMDDAGTLSANYLLDRSEEMEEKITGIELDFTDMARISASYKLYNPEVIIDELQKDSAWDLGLDVNLSDLTSLSLGYELINNRAQAADDPDDVENGDSEEEEDGSTDDSFEDSKEASSNLEANLQIKF